MDIIGWQQSATVISTLDVIQQNSTKLQVEISVCYMATNMDVSLAFNKNAISYMFYLHI